MLPMNTGLITDGGNLRMEDELTSTKKSLGQHWLNDESTLEDIVDLANITPQDSVLEIGPGLGSLTARLLNKTKNVVAVEFDTSLEAKLRARFKDEPKPQLYFEDIRKFNLGLLPAKYKLVANIPYYITNYLIRLISEASNPPSLAVLLIQKEVADRLLAKPGNLSVLGIIAQSYWQIEPGPIVGPEKFTPPPKVNSQVVKLTRLVRPRLPEGKEKEFIRLVRIGFAQKRKTVLNSLSGGLCLDRQKVQLMLESAGINPFSRPQELSIEDWLRLKIAQDNNT